MARVERAGWRKSPRWLALFSGLATLGAAAAQFLLGILLLPESALAQVSSATLSGIVYDASGAVVPNIKVSVTNPSTGASLEEMTSKSGYFSFPQLRPGTYDVRVTAPGFKSWEQKAIPLSAAESRNVPNIQLQVGAVTESVTVETGVEAIAPLDTGSNTTTLNTNMVSNIAIQGRNAAELIKLMPGIGLNTSLGQNPWVSLTTQTNSGPIGQFSASGTQPYGGLQLTLDGGLLVDTGNQGEQIANINQDHTAEMTIRNSAFEAQYARGPSVVEAIGKSGTRDFHGGGYLYARNGIFNAEDAQLKGQNPLPKPDDSYYYPGVTLGGPVIIPGTNFNKNRDKLFFFAGFEYMKQNPSGTLHQYFVPTPDMLGLNPNKPYADFSPSYLKSLGVYGQSAIVPCSDTTTWQYSTFCGTPTGQTIVNGQIPLNLLDPNALAIAKLFPAPNIDPTTHGGNNYQFLDNPPVNRWELKARVDYDITDKTHAYFSYGRQDETDINNISVWWWPSDTVPYPSKLTASQVAHLYSTSVLHVFMPSLTNEVTFNYNSFINPIRASNLSAVSPSVVGYNVQNPFDAGTTPMIPNLLSWACWVGTGGCFPGLWAPAFAKGFQNGAFGTLKRTLSLSDNLSWVKGNHVLKLGFFWAHGGNQETEGIWDTNYGFPQGRYEYDPWGYYSSNNPLADFVLGKPTNFAQTSADPLHTMWFNEIAFYAQDAWRISNRVTLNFGLRANREGQWYPVDKGSPGVAVWDPSTCAAANCTGNSLPGLTWHAINPRIPVSGFPSQFTYDPRVGVSYDIFGTGKTVLRGGYGSYRYQLSYADVSGSLDPPLGIQAFQTTCNLTSMADIESAACLPTSPGGSLPASSGGLSVQALMRGDNRTPHVQNWNVLIDQQLPWKSLLEFGYVGSHTANMLIAMSLANVNRIPMGALFGPNPADGITYFCQGTPSATCVAAGPPTTTPYLPYNYGAVIVSTHGSYSNYNALQTSWQKQTGRSVFMVNYTFSKVLGIRDGQTNNGNGNGAVLDVFHLDSNYGPLAYDHTHIFNLAGVFALPELKGGSGFAKGALNGWKFSPVAQYQSGAPFQPNTGGTMNANYTPGISSQSVLGTDAMALVPLLTCNPGSGLKSGQYFNPQCFAEPKIHSGVEGPLNWPYFRGPAYWDIDTSLYKTFKITERQHIEFRVQAFNFLNHDLPTFQFGGGRTGL